MKNVDDLIQSAAELADHGLSKGEIADELNVSRKTAAWLVTHGETATAQASKKDGTDAGPQDIHVDWSAFGRDSTRLGHAGAAMADLLSKEGESVDLTIGIEKAGAPLSTIVARALDTDLGTYTPRKHKWDNKETDDLESGGTFSRNFAAIRARECFVVDDTITSGTTMEETIDAIQEQGGVPVACAVLVDKHGVDEINGVPVHSLLQVLRVGNSE